MLSRKELSKYLKGKPRFIKGILKNGKFTPYAMLSKKEDAAKRVSLMNTLTAMETMKLKTMERANTGRAYNDAEAEAFCVNLLKK